MTSPPRGAPPVPSVLAVFDVSVASCLLDDLDVFLKSLTKSSSAGTRVVERSDMERAIFSYSENHIRKDHPDGFSACYSKSFCDTCYGTGDLSVREIEVEKLAPFLAALESEYKNPFSSHLCCERHPPHVGLALVLPHDELERGKEIACATLRNYQAAMPMTHFHFVYVHETESEISGVGRLFDLVCEASERAPPALENPYFVVLNRPVPFHETALHFLADLARKSRNKNKRGPFPCVAFKDGTDTSMSLAPVPTSRMAVSGDQLRAFFSSNYCAQAKRLNLSIWDSSLSMFVTYYVPNHPGDAEVTKKEGPRALYATMWPYASTEESMTFGIDASKRLIEFLAEQMRIPEVCDFLFDARRLPKHCFKKTLDTCRDPRYGTYDATVPIAEKPRSIPYWNIKPSPAEEYPPLPARMTYFTILHEACKLNTLASFEPCYEKLKSPAMVMATIAPPESIALLALEFVYDVQSWALGRCIEALRYNKSPETESRNGAGKGCRPPQTGAEAQLGGTSGPGVLRERHAEASL